MSETALTEADKRRIEEEEEERYRKEVRGGLRGEEKKKSKAQEKEKGKGCLTVIIVFVALGVFVGAFSSPGKEEEKNKPSPTPVIERDFKAGVSFTGTQFLITNLDNLDCQNAKMEINGGFFKGGYGYEGYTLEAGETYEVGAMQFTEKDGTRFNPFETKPKDFTIICRGSNALDGLIYVGSFK